ncbi:MAG: type II toxin-antitoxin system RelE/ParE family toxin [Flavobacteriaceae bacterium]|jgi:plasmid stabilization system protein ParE|nr:type II toxin-antitoxin system RelE/ParE family toxin [Flavobacteriaceae bacterium]
MSYNLILLPEAIADLQEHFKWYKDINVQLGKRFLAYFRIAKQRVKKNPYHFQVRYDDVRIIHFEKFPHQIHYTIENKTIFIHSIFHDKQNSPLNEF